MKIFKRQPPLVLFPSGGRSPRPCLRIVRVQLDRLAAFANRFFQFHPLQKHVPSQPVTFGSLLLSGCLDQLGQNHQRLIELSSFRQIVRFTIACQKLMVGTCFRRSLSIGFESIPI